MSYLIVFGEDKTKSVDNPSEVVSVLHRQSDARAWEVNVEDGMPVIGLEVKLGPGRTVSEIQKFGLMRQDEQVGEGQVRVNLDD